MLSQVVTRQPGDVARKLELARRQQELALHYAQASAAADAGDWEQAVAGNTVVAEANPAYRDTERRLANARHSAMMPRIRIRMPAK